MSHPSSCQQLAAEKRSHMEIDSTSDGPVKRTCRVKLSRVCAIEQVFKNLGTYAFSGEVSLRVPDLGRYVVYAVTRSVMYSNDESVMSMVPNMSVPARDASTSYGSLLEQ
jgi:hypothetical protein